MYDEVIHLQSKGGGSFDGKIYIRPGQSDWEEEDNTAISFIKNKPDLTPSNKSWINLVSGWTVAPTLHSTETEYDVWKYTYGDTKLYRTVYKTYTAGTDKFYSEPTLENIVASRPLTF